MIKVKLNNRRTYTFTDKTIKQFFEITESTPDDLIEWMKRNIDYRYPCLVDQYKKFTIGDSLRNDCMVIKTIAGKMICIPVNPLGSKKYIISFWEGIQDNKKAFTDFIKQLKSTTKEGKQKCTS